MPPVVFVFQSCGDGIRNRTVNAKSRTFESCLWSQLTRINNARKLTGVATVCGRLSNANAPKSVAYAIRLKAEIFKIKPLMVGSILTRAANKEK